MTLDEYSFIARILAAIVWTLLLVHVARGGTVMPTHLRRVLVTGSAVVVLWAFVLRSLTILGVLPYDLTAVLNTAAVAAVFIVGLALLTLRLEQ